LKTKLIFCKIFFYKETAPAKKLELQNKVPKPELGNQEIQDWHHELG